jgi:pimeloyl-ACP methyl ester carboxylesterase
LILLLFFCFSFFLSFATIIVEEQSYVSNYERDQETRLLNWLSWIPEGKTGSSYSEDCSPQRIDSIFEQKQNHFWKSRTLQYLVSQCESQWNRDYVNRYNSVAEYYILKYPMLNQNHIKKVKINFVDRNRKVNGFFAAQKGERPIILFQCGLYCDGSPSSSHRMAMMHFYEEAGFHVLTLGNMTGKDFQVENKILSLGGFDEGRQLYDLAKMIKKSKHFLGAKVSSVHVFGVSLGGHAALYSSLYASLNVFQGKKVIDSVTAMCPVVNLKPALDQLFNKKILSKAIAYYTWARFQTLIQYIPILREIFNEIVSKNPQKVKDNVKTAALEFHRQMTKNEDWPLNPFLKVRVNSEFDFWRINTFKDFANKIFIPTLVLASKDDFIVTTETNAMTLNSFNQKNSWLQSVFFQKGSHCAIGNSAGWKVASKILTGFVKSNSGFKDSKEKTRIYTFPIHFFRKHRIYSDESIGMNQLLIQANKTYATLKMRIFDPSLAWENPYLYCNKPFYHSTSDCFQTKLFYIPLRSLGLSPVYNDRDAENLTRRLNLNLMLYNESWQSLTGKREWPKYLKFNY